MSLSNQIFMDWHYFLLCQFPELIFLTRFHVIRESRILKYHFNNCTNCAPLLFSFCKNTLFVELSIALSRFPRPAWFMVKCKKLLSAKRERLLTIFTLKFCIFESLAFKVFSYFAALFAAYFEHFLKMRNFSYFLKC